MSSYRCRLSRAAVDSMAGETRAPFEAGDTVKFKLPPYRKTTRFRCAACNRVYRAATACPHCYPEPATKQPANLLAAAARAFQRARRRDTTHDAARRTRPDRPSHPSQPPDQLDAAASL